MNNSVKSSVNLSLLIVKHFSQYNKYKLQSTLCKHFIRQSYVYIYISCRYIHFIMYILGCIVMYCIVPIYGIKILKVVYSVFFLFPERFSFKFDFFDAIEFILRNF